MLLTDTKIRKAKPGDKPRKMADGGGLYLLITRAGKYWRWKYRHQGKERVMALGVYPDISLLQARQLHQDARAVLASGLDPAKQRQEQKRAPHWIWQSGIDRFAGRSCGTQWRMTWRNVTP